MNRSPSTLAVASAADARYALPLAVMLNSVGSHAGPDVRIEANVLDDGVSDQDKLKVAASLPANVQLKWRQPASKPTFLFCGRLEVEKGVHVLIRTFSRLHREFTTTRLVVAGRGAERSKLENLTGSLGVAESADFLGWMSPRQLERPRSQAWASVVPSVWAEPQGIVAVEAIMRGVPVISSSAGGLGEIVEHGVSGLLFPNNDEEACAYANPGALSATTSSRRFSGAKRFNRRRRHGRRGPS